MPTTASPEAKRRAILRAQARINPNLAADIRDDIANFTALRRRCELMLSGELKIPTRATPAKLRAQILELDSDIAELRQQLAVLCN